MEGQATLTEMIEGVIDKMCGEYGFPEVNYGRMLEERCAGCPLNRLR